MCFWMRSGDKDNYGTPFSYATINQDNEVLSKRIYITEKGHKVVHPRTMYFTSVLAQLL